MRARKRGTCRRAPGSEPGFTLIELLIVVAIIGIIAGIATVQLRTTPQRAKEAVLRENLFVMRDVIDQYFADKGKYPDSLNTLVEEGYMALTFDFRGYGGSGGNQDIELIDRDVEAAFEFLGEQGARAVFLAGASMGGTASLKLAARQAVPGVISLSAPIEFKGLSLEDEQVQVPVLLLTSQGDRRATKSADEMINEGIVGGPELVRQVVFEEGNDHGTDILEGEVATSAREAILSFLQEYGP